jgi:hypothetical protein
VGVAFAAGAAATAGLGGGGAARFFAASSIGTGSGRAGSAPITRRFTFSTTTCLVRPWLKLCLTTPVSVRGFSVKVALPEPTLSFFSPGFFVSVIPFPVFGHPDATRFHAQSARIAGPEALKTRNTRDKRISGGARKQGCMYHI